MLTIFTKLWKRPEKIATDTKSETMSRFNEIFKYFLNNYSWFFYLVTGLLVLFCVYCYIHERKRRLDLRTRRENFQRSNERVPQRRRPGAIYRDHQILRNAMKTVRQYIEPNAKQGSQVKSYVLKTTRSGAVYGSFSDQEES